jgi:hypothetical protein
MMTLSREDLDGLGCSTPECDHIHHSVAYLHPRCHPDAGTWTSYDKRTGSLTIQCRHCDKPFATFSLPPTRRHLASHPSPPTARSIKENWNV